MNGELRELYQEVILDHNRQPRNRRKITAPDAVADGHNPLCGDKVTVYLKLDAGKIADVSFEGSGCAISTASASLMTEALKGKSVDEASKLFEVFHKLVTGESIDNENIGKLAVFAGVSEFPVRVKCASLAWHTLQAALKGGGKPISTE